MPDAAPDAASRPPRRAACIDVGSNGIRCAAAEGAGPGMPRILWQERAAVRLGASVFRDGAIDGEAMDAAVAALAGFRARLAPLEPIALRAVATSAVRDARNRAEFLRRARDEAGVPLEAISAAEEARLVHVAVARRMRMDAPWLLLDVGGGSVQASLATQEAIRWTKSLPLGAVRLLEQDRAAAPAEGGPDQVHPVEKGPVEEALQALPLPGGPEVAGVAALGGNAEALADLAGRRGGGASVDVVPLEGLEALLREMRRVSRQDRARRWGLPADRADVIVPAGCLCAHAARLAGAKAIHVPRVSLRDGVLAELLEGGSR